MQAIPIISVEFLRIYPCAGINNHRRRFGVKHSKWHRGNCWSGHHYHCKRRPHLWQHSHTHTRACERMLWAVGAIFLFSRYSGAFFLLPVFVINFRKANLPDYPYLVVKVFTECCISFGDARWEPLPLFLWTLESTFPRLCSLLP